MFNIECVDNKKKQKTEKKGSLERKKNRKKKKRKSKGKKKKRADRRLCYAGQSKAPLELHKGPHQFSECIFFFFLTSQNQASEKKKKRANGQKNCRVQRHNALPEVKQTKDLCEGAQ